MNENSLKLVATSNVFAETLLETLLDQPGNTILQHNLIFLSDWQKVEKSCEKASSHL